MIHMVFARTIHTIEGELNGWQQLIGRQGDEDLWRRLSPLFGNDERVEPNFPRRQPRLGVTRRHNLKVIAQATDLIGVSIPFEHALLFALDGDSKFGRGQWLLPEGNYWRFGHSTRKCPWHKTEQRDGSEQTSFPAFIWRLLCDTFASHEPDHWPLRAMGNGSVYPVNEDRIPAEGGSSGTF